MHGATFTICPHWLNLTFNVSFFFFGVGGGGGKYGQSTESKNFSEKLGDSNPIVQTLKNNIYLDTLMTPQTTGKLAREHWRAATVMKEKWFCQVRREER